MIHIVEPIAMESKFTFATQGLSAMGHPEVLVEVNDSDLITEARRFVRYISDYIVRCGARLQVEETIGYGYWLTKLKDAGENTLETWEYNATATDFVRGASLTLRYWRDQHSLCEAWGADFDPPRPDQLSVISKGVFEGLPVQGVRYSSPDHMSGWWITTDEYDGNIESLKNEHTYHLTAARPDLAKYLALPAGFRFDLSSFEDVWFEEEIAKA